MGLSKGETNIKIMVRYVVMILEKIDGQIHRPAIVDYSITFIAG